MDPSSFCERYARKEAAAARGMRSSSSGSGLFDESYGYGAYDDVGVSGDSSAMRSTTVRTAVEGAAAAVSAAAVDDGDGVDAADGFQPAASSFRSTSPTIPELHASGNRGGIAASNPRNHTSDGKERGGGASGDGRLLDYTDDSSYVAAAAAALAAATSSISPGGGSVRSSPIAIGSPLTNIDLLSPSVGAYDPYEDDEDDERDHDEEEGEATGGGVQGNGTGTGNGTDSASAGFDGLTGEADGDAESGAVDGWTFVAIPDADHTGDDSTNTSTNTLGPATISTTHIAATSSAPSTPETSPTKALSTIKMAPQHTWERDKDHAKCQECESPFTFVKRRHHCRACGHVACGKCAPYRLPHGHKEKIRLCKLCALQF